MHGPDSLLAGRYRLHERVGAGGMGEVWRATDETLGRTVAVKMMQPGLLDDPSFGARFRAEARMMASIDHPGVVGVRDYYRDDEIALLAMDFVPGESLARLLARQGRLPPARAMEIIAQAADALHAAHQIGVVHRDVKPANLLIRPDGTVVLTDFGIARSHAGTQLTATGALLGTLSYLAPEQVLGDPATPRSDVYALGVVAYECLTGRRPFERENPFASAMARVREAPPTLPGDVPVPVAAIVSQALAADPAHRPPTASDLAAACRRAATAPLGPPVPPPAMAPPMARPMAPPISLAAPRQRRRGLGFAIAGGAAGMAGVLVAGIVVAYNVVAGLGDGPGPSPPPASGSPAEPVAAGCEPFAAYQGHQGSTVTVLSDSEPDRHQETFGPFIDCTGISVGFEAVDPGDFQASLQTRVAAGSPPDLAVMPASTQLADLAADGQLVPAGPQVQARAEEWLAGLRSGGSLDGTLYGVPLGVEVHSLVWYSPAYFLEHGYEAPATWEEMISLSDTIAADGDKPWCEGWDPLAWPAGSWLADAMLRLHGGDFYERWARHEISSVDPGVIEAIDLVGQILQNPDYVNGGFGGPATITDVFFDQLGTAILDGECAMYRQAGFYRSLFPDGTDLSPEGDVWAFYLPPLRDATARPAVVSTSYAVAFADRPEVAAVHEYLSSVEWAEARVGAGGYATGERGVDPATAPDPVDQLLMEILQAPDAEVHFPPASVTPPPVYNAVWEQMDAWVQGQDTRTTAGNIEDAWP